MKTVSAIYAPVMDVIIVCPHCDERQSDFTSNPQGEIYECDQCGEEYQVAPDATVKLYGVNAETDI